MSVMLLHVSCVATIKVMKLTFICLCALFPVTLLQWVSSISGPEGDVAAKSTGSLLFASGLAGSLNGCMVVDKDRDSHLLASLLFPPPALALTVSTNRDHKYVSSIARCVCVVPFTLRLVAHHLFNFCCSVPGLIPTCWRIVSKS